MLATIKDISAIIAALGVLCWSIYSSVLKNEVKIAELQKLELEQKTSLRSALLPTMKVEQIKSEDGGTVLSIGMKFRNAGTEQVRLILNDRSALVAEIDFSDVGVSYIDEVYIGNSRFVESKKIVASYIDIGPKEEYEIYYVHKIKRSGMYFIRFLTPMKSESVNSDKEKFLGKNPILSYSTGVDKVVQVK
jgi:hypothetical protein